MIPYLMYVLIIIVSLSQLAEFQILISSEEMVCDITQEKPTEIESIHVGNT